LRNWHGCSDKESIGEKKKEVKFKGRRYKEWYL